MDYLSLLITWVENKFILRKVQIGLRVANVKELDFESSQYHMVSFKLAAHVVQNSLKVGTKKEEQNDFRVSIK